MSVRLYFGVYVCVSRFVCVYLGLRVCARACVCTLCPQVSELVKLPDLAKPKVVLAITDLTLPLGRRVAAKAIAAL